MKTFFLLLVLITKLSISSNAQNLITVQNGTSVSFYTTIPLAISAANNGDTIYIPGGTWNIGSLNINKRLHIFGVGHNPDSAQASSISYISGNFYLTAGASNGSISGLVLKSGGISVNPNTEPVLFYTISRNNIEGGIHIGNNCTNWVISENITPTLVGGINSNQKSLNNGVFNNIIYNNIYFFGSGNVFKNNLFSNWNYINQQRSIEYSLFENNIILFPSSGPDPIPNGDVRNCQFNNNIFVANYAFPMVENLGSSNIVNQSQSSIFINQSGFTFNYAHDYHLKASSPGKNAGTDGMDIGLYGGLFPWKDGSLPPNPHIQFKSISNTTDQNGNLQINFKVKAQNH